MGNRFSLPFMALAVDFCRTAYRKLRVLIGQRPGVQEPTSVNPGGSIPTGTSAKG
jgi:hypothetical protein